MFSIIEAKMKFTIEIEVFRVVSSHLTLHTHEAKRASNIPEASIDHSVIMIYIMFCMMYKQCKCGSEDAGSREFRYAKRFCFHAERFEFI